MRLFVNGGGSGSSNEEIYNLINEIIDHSKPLLYIPLAMDNDKRPYDGCYEWIKNELKIIDVPSIKMVRSFEEMYNLDLNDYSFIFIGGGNTYRLLYGLKESNTFVKLKEYINNNGIVYGGSAGAVILGNDVSCSTDEDVFDLRDTSGLDVVNGYSIFPHYTNKKKNLSEEKNKKRLKNTTFRLEFYSKIKNKIIGLLEEDTIFITGNEISVLGTKPYYIFEKGIKSIFYPNQNKMINNKK